MWREPLVGPGAIVSGSQHVGVSQLLHERKKFSFSSSGAKLVAYTWDISFPIWQAGVQIEQRDGNAYLAKNAAVLSHRLIKKKAMCSYTQRLVFTTDAKQNIVLMTANKIKNMSMSHGIKPTRIKRTHLCTLKHNQLHNALNARSVIEAISSHQIRSAWKWFGWIDLEEYIKIAEN
jgi:hypothetical protein